MKAEPPVAKRDHELVADCRQPTAPDESSSTDQEWARQGATSLHARSLERVPESALAARALVAGALQAWGLAQLMDDTLLVVTELVSNAVAHASGPGMRVSVVRVTALRVRVSVIDPDRTRPQPACFNVKRERGRGLLLVEALSHRWGVHLLRGGKAVWAELEVPS